MRLIVKVVCAVVVVVVAAMGNPTSPDEVPTSPQSGEGWANHCGDALLPGNAGQELNYWEHLAQCTATFLHVRRQEVQSANTLEETQLLMKHFCTGLPLIRQCFGNFTSLSEACQNEHQQKLFKIHRSNFESGLEIVCVQEGERFAFAVTEVKKNLNMFDVRNCESEARNLVQPGTPNDTEVSLQMYKAVKTMKQCLVGLGQELADKAGVDAVETLLNELQTKMLCATLEQENGVLCAGLDTGTADNSIETA